MIKKILAIAAFSLGSLALAAPLQAQHSRGSAPPVRGGTAVPRGGGGAPGRPAGPAHPGGGGYYGGRYYGHYYGGYPYYYSPYYYPYGFYGGYYGNWGLSFGFGYGYPYGYPPYGYYGGYYLNHDEALGIGGVQIKGAPKDAQVFADGYYAGTVEDFDGTFQHLDLGAGPHRVEIRQEGRPPVAFEVNVHPGETITYHAQ